MTSPRIGLARMSPSGPWNSASFGLFTRIRGSRFIPVQVRFKASRSGFTLAERELEKSMAAGTVVAYCSIAEPSKRQFPGAETRFWPMLDYESGGGCGW